MKSKVEKYLAFCSTPFGKELMDKEAEYLKAELKGRKKILDVGCGIGTFEQRMSNFNISAIDVDDEMLKIAREKAPKSKFYSADAIKIPFKDSSFNAVFFVTSLEFIDDYKKAIDESVRVLQSKGKLVLMILNPESLYFKSHFKKKGSYFRKIKHQNLSEILDYISMFFKISTHYFLGIDGDRIFNTSDIKYASLFVLTSIKFS
jgi:ubiquinone/menaquinone biosynthesis C-methylase UbiE